MDWMNFSMDAETFKDEDNQCKFLFVPLVE